MPKGVYVEWIDSAGSDEAWTEGDIELARIKTVGFVVRDTRKSLTLAQSRDDNKPAKWDNLLIIAKQAIINRKSLGNL